MSTTSNNVFRLVLPWPKTFTAAMILDSVGDGIWSPFTLLFFTHYMGQSLTTTGAALSLGALVSLVAGGLPAGALVDRIGAFRSAILANVIQALAFPLFLLSGSFFAIAGVSMLIGIGKRVFWAAQPTMVGSLVQDDATRSHAFGVLNSIRNIGMGIGAAATMSYIGIHAAGSFYIAIVLLNALSFVVAALLLWPMRKLEVPAEAHKEGAVPAAGPSYRDLLSDYRIVIYTLANTAICLASVSFVTILPVFLIDSIALPAWTPSAIYLISCIAIPAFLPVATYASRHWRSLSILVAVAVILAAYFVALPLLPQSTTISLTLIVVLAVVFSLAEALWGAVFSTVVLELAPVSGRGRYSAFFQLSFALATTLGPGVFAFSLQRSAAGLWIGLALAVAMAGCVFFLLDRKRVAQNS